MKYYTIFLAILCSTQSVNTASSDDVAQDAPTELKINLDAQQKRKKKIKKVLLPCVYIGAAFIMVLMGKKGWSYYTHHTQNKARPNPASDPDQTDVQTWLNAGGRHPAL